MCLIVFKLLTCVVLCFGQQAPTRQNETSFSEHTSLSSAIGNFSLELLYLITESQTDNVVMSPFNVWSALAVTAEGALKYTREELNHVLRITNSRTVIRSAYQNISRDLKFNTNTVKLNLFTGIVLHKELDTLEPEYQRISRIYATSLFLVNFTDSAEAASRVNRGVSIGTRSRITKLVEKNDFSEPEMLLTSAAYLKGQWTTAFNVLSTAKQPFYDSNGTQIGKVNMMCNRHTYPLLDVPGIQGKVIELPYGAEEQVSLLVMLPYPSVSLRDMLRKFAEVPLDVIFSKLKLYQQEHGQEKVDCLIPRFSVESNLELKETLKKLGINTLCDNRANLGLMFRNRVHVTKILHKAVIGVSEDGVTASATDSDLTNATDVPRFEANRPFAYFVIGKRTNTVLYQGIYQRPYLY